jgi:putative FmdB family regulatory protein
MPVYEYACQECGRRFDALRRMKDADAPIPCVQCRSDRTLRKLSVFYAQSDGRSVAGTSHACGSCAGGTCSTCSN